jgi:hypothetical protein
MITTANQLEGEFSESGKECLSLWDIARQQGSEESTKFHDSLKQKGLLDKCFVFYPPPPKQPQVRFVGGGGEFQCLGFGVVKAVTPDDVI